MAAAGDKVAGKPARISPLRDLSTVPPQKARETMHPFAGDTDTWHNLGPEFMPNPRSENFIVTVGCSYIGGTARTRLFPQPIHRVCVFGVSPLSHVYFRIHVRSSNQHFCDAFAVLC
jgi:hypothetical protein